MEPSLRWADAAHATELDCVKTPSLGETGKDRNAAALGLRLEPRPVSRSSYAANPSLHSVLLRELRPEQEEWRA